MISPSRAVTSTINSPYDSPHMKFHQDFGCPSLEKHDYVCNKDVIEAATIVDNFNEKFPKAPYQPCPNQGTYARLETEGVGTGLFTINNPSNIDSYPSALFCPNYVTPRYPDYPSPKPNCSRSSLQRVH